MRYKAKDMRPYLRGPDARRVTTLAAGRVLARARMLVGKGPNRPDQVHTAATGRLEHGIGGLKQDRVVVRVVFEGAAVPEQFGNRTRPASRFLTRALES